MQERCLVVERRKCLNVLRKTLTQFKNLQQEMKTTKQNIDTLKEGLTSLGVKTTELKQVEREVMGIEEVENAIDLTEDSNQEIVHQQVEKKIDVKNSGTSINEEEDIETNDSNTEQDQLYEDYKREAQMEELKFSCSTPVSSSVPASPTLPTVETSFEPVSQTLPVEEETSFEIGESSTSTAPLQTLAAAAAVAYPLQSTSSSQSTSPSQSASASASPQPSATIGTCKSKEFTASQRFQESLISTLAAVHKTANAKQQRSTVPAPVTDVVIVTDLHSLKLPGSLFNETEERITEMPLEQVQNIEASTSKKERIPIEKEVLEELENLQVEQNELSIDKENKPSTVTGPYFIKINESEDANVLCTQKNLEARLQRNDKELFGNMKKERLWIHKIVINQDCSIEFFTTNKGKTHTIKYVKNQRFILCGLCDLEYKKMSDCKRHEDRCGKDKKYNCPDCECSFVALRTWRDHYAAKHTFKKRVGCNDCPATFYSVPAKLWHMKKLCPKTGNPATVFEEDTKLEEAEKEMLKNT